MTSTTDHLYRLQDLVADELKVVTYKWLARELGIPVNTAKQLLFAFKEQQSSKVQATFLLSGWTKGLEPHHVVRLLPEAQLSTGRLKLEPLTSMHVYSVQASQPKDPSELWNTDFLQTEALFNAMVMSDANNCLVDNRHSAVRCAEAKRDATLAMRRPVLIATAEQPAAAPAKPARQPASGASKLADNSGSGSAAAAAAIGAKADKAAAGQGSVATVPQAQGTAAARRPSAAPAGKGVGKLASLWKKAPAKQDKPTAASPAPAAAAADADAALRLAHNDDDEGSSSGSDDEEVAVHRRVTKASARRIVEEEEEQEPARGGSGAGRCRGTTVVEESSDEEPEAPPAAKAAVPAAAPAAARTAERSSKRASKAAAAMEEDEDIEIQVESEVGPPSSSATAKDKAGKATAKKGKKSASAAAKKGAEVDEDMPDAPAGGAGKKRAAPPAAQPGPAKLRENLPAGTNKRRREMRTTIDDKGDEVTEMVWVGGEEVTGSQPEAMPEKPAKQAQDAAPTRSSGSGKPAGAKGATAKPAAPAGNKGKGKGSKAAPSGQKGIMSFFKKQ